jgi:hypothetical protein
MIKEFLLKVINIKIVNFILIVYLFTALFSHFKIIFETEKITKQLLESKDMPEWKSKFLKEKTHRVEIYKKNYENLYVTSYKSLIINN